MLAIEPRFTKVGRSSDLDKRLDFWRSHGVQIGLKLETTDVESHLLEWAMLRANLKPSDGQIKAYMRRNPLFPCNRLALPQGCSEWICSDMTRAKMQTEILLPVVRDVADGLAPEDSVGFRKAKSYFKTLVPRADGRK